MLDSGDDLKAALERGQGEGENPVLSRLPHSWLKKVPLPPHACMALRHHHHHPPTVGRVWFLKNVYVFFSSLSF